MKAPPFAYVRPSTLAGAVDELSTAGGNGKIIAGGQSLVPMLAMRLARPDTLIDINALDELDSVVVHDGHVEIGATVRQRRIECDAVAARVPLLGMALPWVGHRELRSRGTVCGSLAHADPAAELPAVACCVGAELTLTGNSGSRKLSADEFFTGVMTTALGPDEILTSVRFPVAVPGEGFGFAETARRHGDFALAGVAVRVTLHSGEPWAVLTGFGISDRPVTRNVSSELSSALALSEQDGHGIGDVLHELMDTVTDELVRTDGDVHASRGYRRRLFRVLACRELERAYRQARDQEGIG